MVMVTEELSDRSVGGRIDSPLLLLGLIYREVSRAMELEPGVETSAPSHLINSPFGVEQLDQLCKFINGLDFSTS